MTDASVIYNVIVRFQYQAGEKAAKITQNLDKQTQKLGKGMGNLNKLLKVGAVRLFSLIFLMRRMRDGIVNMMKPAADMVGITDLWNMTLGMLFLPVMEAILPLMLWFTDLISALPDSMKLAIGVIAGISVVILTLGMGLAGVSIGLSAISALDIAATFAKISTSITTMTGATTLLGGALKLAFGVGIVAGIVMLLFWLNSVKDEMGGWENFFKNIVKGVARVFVLLGGVVAGSFASAWDLIKQGWNALIGFFESGFNKILGWINSLIDTFNKITHSDVAHVATANFSAAKMDVNSGGAAGAFTDAYSNIMEPYLAWEAANLATKTLDQVKADNAANAKDASTLSQIDAYKSAGMDNASIANLLIAQRNGTGSSPSVVVNQTNNVSGLVSPAEFQKLLAERDRQAQAILNARLASGQVG